MSNGNPEGSSDLPRVAHTVIQVFGFLSHLSGLEGWNTFLAFGSNTGNRPEKSLQNTIQADEGLLGQDRAKPSVPVPTAPPSFSSLYYILKKKKSLK